MAHGGESPADALTRWRACIERITNDLIRSRASHRTWDETRRRWNANPSLRIKNDAMGWILRAHTDSLALAIRREVDRDRRSISLWNLLSELERKARYVTLEAYVALAGSNADQQAHRETEAQEWLEPGTNHLNPAIPAADLADLERATNVVREYVNRAVAHRDGEGVRSGATLRDLTLSLERIETIAQRWNLILRSISYWTYEPERGFDPTLFFRRPWQRARWRKGHWPPETVERIGEFRETFDALKRSDYLDLWRARHRIAEQFSKTWRWDAPTDSPIGTTLDALGLPSSDAAVMWVRDRLLQRDREPPS